MRLFSKLFKESLEYISKGKDQGCLETSMVPEHGYSCSKRHFGQNHHIVLVVSWSNCQNFNKKFNFKLLSPLKNQNPSYGSKVTAIWNNKTNSPPPTTRKLFGLVVTNLEWKKIAPTPLREHLVVSSWQISNKKKLTPPHHKKIILSRGDIKKKCSTPPGENYFVSSW